MEVKILVVDDEILQARLIGNVIRRYRPDYDVVTTHQPKEALALLQTGRFDALMTDVKMPEIDGIELIRLARTMDISPLEIIILSGFDDFQYARSAITFDVLDYLLKPLDEQSLQRALNRLEEKLRQNRSHRKMRDAYSTMSDRQCAAILFKMMHGFNVTSVERGVAEQRMGERVYVALLEGCRDARESFQAIESPSSRPCVENIAPGVQLLFIPAAQDRPLEFLPSLEPGIAVVSRPCAFDELQDMHRVLAEYLETAKQLGLRRVVQQIGAAPAISAFSGAIRALDAAKIRAEEPQLQMALINGEATLAQLRRTAHAAVEELVSQGRLPMVYPRMEKELLSLLEEKLSACGNAKQICAEITALLDRGMQPEQDAQDAFEHSVRVYIERNYAQSCSLNEISREFHYSAAHFNRLFQVAFGDTYTRYLADYRLARACELLRDSDLSVREIASRVGINDAGYLTRMFKRKYKMSPVKYRQYGTR